MPTSTEKFPRDTAGLPAVSATGVVELADGDRFALHIAPVAKRIGDATVRMLAYNGSIPGPTLRVPQGAEVLVDIENEGDMENDRALARAAPGEPLRRHARDSGPHPGRRPLSRPASRSRTPASTGTTRTSARTTTRRWGSTATSSSTPADPDYWAPREP